jgi:hypothetical protein
MSDLHAIVQNLCEAFTEKLLHAIRTASLTDLLAERQSSGSGARWTRRDADDTVASMLDVLRRAPAGLRAEDLRRKLGVPPHAMLRAVRKALDAKQIRRTGARRGTRYFVV